MNDNSPPEQLYTPVYETPSAYNYSLYLRFDVSEIENFEEPELPPRVSRIIKMVPSDKSDENVEIINTEIPVGIKEDLLDIFLEWLFKTLPEKYGDKLEIFDPQSSSIIEFAQKTELKNKIMNHDKWIVYNLGADSLNLYDNVPLTFFGPKAKLLLLFFGLMVFLFFFTEFLVSVLL